MLGYWIDIIKKDYLSVKGARVQKNKSCKCNETLKFDEKKNVHVCRPTCESELISK